MELGPEAAGQFGSYCVSQRRGKGLYPTEVSHPQSREVNASFVAPKLLSILLRELAGG